MNTRHVTCSHCAAKNRVPVDRLAEDPVCGRCGRALLPAEPIELSDLNFDTVIRGTELPVVVDFWASWCGPCRMMAPAFAEAARTLKGQALLVKVNSDDSPQLSSRYAIRSIPTLIKLEQGREVQRQSGAVPVSTIVALARA